MSDTMRYATFSVPNDRTVRVGVVEGDKVLDLGNVLAGKLPADAKTLLALIQSGPATWRQAAAIRDAPTARASGAVTYEASSVKWLAPIPRPAKNIFCLGLNYVAHMQETSRARERQAK